MTTAKIWESGADFDSVYQFGFGYPNLICPNKSKRIELVQDPKKLKYFFLSVLVTFLTTICAIAGTMGFVLKTLFFAEMKQWQGLLLLAASVLGLTFLHFDHMFLYRLDFVPQFFSDLLKFEQRIRRRKSVYKI